MICLYDKTETDFNTNGICVLNPITCVVGETAGGGYELRMEHPIDDAGIFMLLQEDMIIKAPVPVRHIPEITLPNVVIWETTEAADVYSVLPVWKKEEVDETIKQIRRHPDSYTWKVGSAYNKGALVTYGGLIYRAQQYNFAVVPTSTAAVWAYVTTVAESSSGTYIPGKVIETLASGTTIYKIADFNKQYMQIRTLSGTIGYVERAKCDETQQTHSGQVIPARTITEQMFRIYRIEGTDTEHSVVVDARHISYDFAGNSTMDCKLFGADPMTAISIMQGSLVGEDERGIYCNITGKEITEDWSFRNPVNILLDPSSGLLGAVGGAMIRDNREFFILDNETPEKGITIEYGVNMTGVKWTRDIESVITRIIPRANAGVDSFLYLDDLYVDSPAIDDYAYPRIEVMDCAYTVGEQYEKPDGTKQKWNENDIKIQIEKDAQERFDTDHVDRPEITLEVQFLLLGDTEEFKQYRDLQNVSLYDEITVKTGPSGVTATAQVSEYEYDCILRRYNFIRVGDVSSFSQRVPGYRVVRNSITYDKLSVDLINRIRSANASGSENSYSPGSETGGGSVPGAAMNSVDVDGLVAKGSGQASKVWKTDASGNPAWRDENAVPGVVDNLTSTSTTDALSANQGRVLNEKIIPNSATNDGLVTKGQGEANKVWKTDSNGVPAWRNDDDTGSFMVREAGVAPGGSANFITFTAPGAPRHLIMCYAAYMTHVYCNALDNDTVYTNGMQSGFTLTKHNDTYTLTRSATTAFNYVLLWI